jgi:hypothetical protein
MKLLQQQIRDQGFTRATQGAGGKRSRNKWMKDVLRKKYYGGKNPGSNGSRREKGTLNSSIARCFNEDI